MEKQIIKIFSKKNIVLFIIIIFFCSVNCVKAQKEKENFFYLVKYNCFKTRLEVAQNFNIDQSNIERIDQLDVFRIKSDKIIGGWEQSFKSDIDFFEPDYLYQAFADSPEFGADLVPNDPDYSSQWALTKISSAEAWDLTTGSTDVVIAIVDTGIDGTHEDLNGKITAGFNFVNDMFISANSDSDDVGHGTAVAGVASAITNNSVGIAGLDWNARMMPVKVLNSSGTGYASDVAAGIRYAADNGAEIINLSLGGEYPSSVVESAVNYAYNQGCVVVTASGNNGGSISYPAEYDNTIAVGATNSADTRASWSNFGSQLDVVAPGVSIRTLKDGGGYWSTSGTSVSAPHVSALAGLLLSYDSSLSNSAIRSAIREGAEKVVGMDGQNFTDYYGYGRIDAFDSLSGLETYHYSYISQNAYPTLMPGESYTFQLIVENTGTTTWTQDVVRLGTDKSQDRIPFYTRGSGWCPTGDGNRVLMQEESVAPGDQANFNFSITIPTGQDLNTYREYFRLVADGVQWMEDYGIYWDVDVNRPYACWVSQTPHSSDPEADYVTLSPGETTTLTLTMQNSGLITWSQTGSFPVRLGTDKPQDRISSFEKGSGWVSGSANRVQLSQATVAPGEQGTFTFEVIAPSTPGTYREYFCLVSEHLSWMDDYGIYWNIKVE